MNEIQTRESTKPPVERLTYTAREVCIALGIGNTSLWRLHKRGLLVPVAGLRHKIYAIEGVKRFLENKSSVA